MPKPWSKLDNDPTQQRSGSTSRRPRDPCGPDRGSAREMAGTAATVAADVPGCWDPGRPDLGWLQIGATAGRLGTKLDRFDLQPIRSPLPTLVWSGSGRDVDHAMVDGEVLVRNGISVRRHEEGLTAAGGTGFRKVWDWAEKRVLLGSVFESLNQREAKNA